MTDKEKTAAILAALYKKHIDAVCCEELPYYGSYVTAQRRIDFWVLTGGGHQTATAYEIKVSRADFMRDSKEKQEFALRYSDRFFYCTPKGLLDKKEIPEWAGLIEYDIEKARWRTIIPYWQQNPRRKDDPDWAFVLGLIRTSGRVRRDMVGITNQRDFLMQELQGLRQRVKNLETEKEAQLLHQWNEQRKIKSHHFKPYIDLNKIK